MTVTRPDRYSRTAITLHWAAAAIILASLASGFAADTPAGSDAAALRAHVALGASTGVLMLLRLAAWLRFDERPAAAAHANRAEALGAGAAHMLLYVVPLVLVASGIGMLALSGAGADVFSRNPVLPRFENYAPRAVHGAGALLLAGLIALHVGAALWHHFLRRDGLLARMGLALPPTTGPKISRR